MLDVRRDSKPKTNVLFASILGMIAINFVVEFLLMAALPQLLSTASIS